MMTGTYEIIYADPPWRYSAKKVQGAAENHYPTMSIDELCALPVAELAAKDSALFMWATFPQLPEALRLIRAWGFTYKSVAFVWLKKNKKADSWFYGLGFWTRANAEICLLATKGHPKRQAADIHQFIISPIEAHSKKPDETRDKIVALMGDRPRVELFARQTPPGWDVWGNEVEPTAGLWSRWPEDSGKEDVSCPMMTGTASGSMNGGITAATVPLWNRTLRRGYRNTSAFTTSMSGRSRLPAFTSITLPSALWTLGHSPSRPVTPRMRSSTTISASRLKMDHFWRGGI